MGTWLPALCGGEEDGMREAGLAGGQGGLEINAQPERGELTLSQLLPRHSTQSSKEDITGLEKTSVTRCAGAGGVVLAWKK